MKQINTLLLSLIIFLPGYIFCQGTLKNLQPAAARVATKYKGSKWGYYTGHNSSSREEFAEKYYVTGGAKVMGVISEHKGRVKANSAGTSQFKIYKVGKDRLPSTALATKSVPFTKLDLTGAGFTTMFTTPVAVQDSFFVSFNMGDYSHAPLNGDTISVLHGADGSRPDSDLKVYGRNAVRQHSHSTTPVWVDFHTQNFTPLKTHFALFPILDGLNSTTDFKSHEFQIKSVYPNPFVEKITVAVNAFIQSDIHIHIYDQLGKLVNYQRYNASRCANGNLEIACGNLSKGSYVLFVKAGSTGVGFNMIKN